MFDYSALLYDPIYDAIGVPAELTVVGGAGAVAITVIDDTRPKVVQASSTERFDRGSTEVRSIGPGAFARIPELDALGITRADYLDAVLTFNGRTWAVRSYELRGSPNGEDLGEVQFFLKVSTGG